MQTIGPLRLTGDVDDEIMVPLATYETPLWPSVNRGARVCLAAGGIQVTLLNEQMTQIVIITSSATICIIKS